MTTPTTRQHDFIHTPEDGDLDAFIARKGDTYAPQGMTLVDAKIVGGFAEGSFWERKRGIVVEFTYL